MSLNNWFGKVSAGITCCLMLAVSVSAGDLTSIVFESGNLAAAGSAGDGWKFWSGNAGPDRASIGSTGRTFQTGSAANDEALFINPGTAGATESDLEGAEFVSSTPFTFSATDYFYIITETFSDMSVFSDQYLKIDVRVGLAGDGTEYGGFASTAGGSTFSVNSNFNTEASNANRQARIALRDSGGSNNTAEVQDSKYIGDDVIDSFADVDNNYNGSSANNFLDRTYVQKAVYRPNAAGTAATAEMQGTDGTNVYNREGRTGSNPTDPVKALTGYGQLSFDRVSVHLRRHVGAFDGEGGAAEEGANGFTLTDDGSGNRLTGLSSAAVVTGNPENPFDNTWTLSGGADLKLGIKSIRIGVTSAGDLDLDGDVDSLDVTTSFLNYTGVSGTGKTHFDGDSSDDGDIDVQDLNITIGNFSTTPLAAAATAFEPLVEAATASNPIMIYNNQSGEVSIDANGNEITGFSLIANSNIFTSAADYSDLDADVGFGASTTVDNEADQIGWTSAALTGGVGFDGPAIANLGSILPAGLSLVDLDNLFNANGIANSNLWTFFGGTSAASGELQFSVVPEPTSMMLLLGFGSLAFAGMRRRS